MRNQKHGTEGSSLTTAQDDELYSKEAHKTVASFIPIIEPLQLAMPPRTEVVLHDFSKLPNSIVAISGSISGRQVGGPSTDLGLMTWASPNPPRCRIGYHTVLPNGRVARSSSIYIFGRTAKPLGSLCINSDITALLHTRDLIDQMISLGPVGDLTSQFEEVGQRNVETEPLTAVAQHLYGAKSNERFFQTVEEAAQAILQEAIEACGVEVDLMSKGQKTEIVRELKARGFFMLRNAAETAADALKVSRYSIYNYMNDLEDEAPA